MTYPKYSKPVVVEVFGDQNTTSTDMVAPPTVAGGECSQPTGFVQSATSPARQYINWLFNYLTNGIRYLCQRGVADWDASENYYAGDRVQATDGNTYVCQSTGPISSNPVTNGQTDWVAWGLTMAQVGAKFLAAANNLSDLANLSTALANLGFSYGTGYIKLPFLVIQYGSINLSGGASGTFNFPITFPSNFLAMAGIPYLAGSGGTQSAGFIGVSGQTQSQFNAYNSNSYAGVTTYIAIGR